MDQTRSRGPALTGPVPSRLALWILSVPLSAQYIFPSARKGTEGRVRKEGQGRKGKEGRVTGLVLTAPPYSLCGAYSYCLDISYCLLMFLTKLVLTVLVFLAVLVFLPDLNFYCNNISY
jgi:hypothetical protein